MEGQLDINKVSGNPHFKIRLMIYDDLMLVSNHLREIGGYSYIMPGALVVEGTAKQLTSMINYTEQNFDRFEFVDMYEMYLGDSGTIKEMLKKEMRNDKLDDLGI